MSRAAAGARVLALVAATAVVAASPACVKPDARRPGSATMSPQTREMQRDDAQNPAMLWVADGEALWSRAAGPAGRACADCHGDARASMRGVAARHPAYDEASRRPVDLGQRIAACRQRHQQAGPLAPESHERLALEAYVALQSRGMAVAPPADPRLDAHRERGRALFHQRIGQLDLACAQCHDANAGKRLGGSTIPEAHPTGYPIYRLEWQSAGSLQRRLRGCMSGVRAEVPPYDAPDLVDLALHLASRAAGMIVDAPGVRP